MVNTPGPFPSSAIEARWPCVHRLVVLGTRRRRGFLQARLRPPGRRPPSEETGHGGAVGQRKDVRRFEWLVVGIVEGPGSVPCRWPGRRCWPAGRVSSSGRLPACGAERAGGLRRRVGWRAGRVRRAVIWSTRCVVHGRSLHGSGRVWAQHVEQGGRPLAVMAAIVVLGSGREVASTMTVTPSAMRNAVDQRASWEGAGSWPPRSDCEEPAAGRVRPRLGGLGGRCL